MNILVINRSPRGEKSNTRRLTAAFLEGLKEEVQEVRTREVRTSQLDIKPCLGCFSCWSHTPGRCCIQDDMARVIEDLLWADVTMWSFPLYYYSVPGPLKNLIDRQLPMTLPFMEETEGQAGNGGHPSRYDMSGKKTVLISTCGFYTAEGNYDGVRSLFDHECGPGAYTAIFCGQGELFRYPELAARTDAYLARVRQAGREYAGGAISAETQARLAELIMPRETFEACADASWGVERESETLIFTRQMAALYRKENYPGHDLVLEMRYTDVEESYQILLGRDGSRVFTDGSLTATTTVETPFTVWRSISSGELSGEDALMRGLYRVEGDFSLLLKWDDYFGGAPSEPARTEPVSKDRPTNMNIMLLPWMALWIAVSIHKYWGCLISLGVCALVPLVFYRNRKTGYDVLSGALVTGFSAAMLAGAPETWMLPLSYLAFGVMWLGSCPGGRIPLTASYSMNGYGGEKALRNPLFLKTNRILTALWGALYLMTSVFTWFLVRTPAARWVGLMNSALPILMGLFTVWFQSWYPARVARGNRAAPCK